MQYHVLAVIEIKLNSVAANEIAWIQVVKNQSDEKLIKTDNFEHAQTCFNKRVIWCTIPIIPMHRVHGVWQ